MLRVRLPLVEDCESVRLPFPLPAFLSPASCGDMRTERRHGFLRSIGYDPALTVMLRQEHTRNVVTAEDARSSTALLEPARRVVADGVVSAAGGPPLAVGVGDCMPILLFDRGSSAYGLLHSGWRGTGILERAVSLLRELGTDPGDLVVHFGPCIGPEAYVVDAARAREFARWGTGSVVYHHDRPYLDLRAANRNIAERLGITEISYADHCTYSDPRLGSFRREGPEYTGMIAVVGERTG